MRSIAVWGDKVYFAGNDAVLHALDAKTGAVLWGSPSTGGRYVESSPAVANGVVYWGDDAGTLHASDAATGAPLWTSVPLRGEIVSAPAVANGRTAHHRDG